MDFLYKQMRGRLSSAGEEKEENSNTEDRRIPPRKTQSFKGEKKRTPSWLQRQFSRQMSQDLNKNADDYQIAVAAAAFAVRSLEESWYKARKRDETNGNTSLTKVQNKPGNVAPEPEARGRSVKFADGVSKTKSDIQDTRVPIRTETMEKVPEKAVAQAPSIKKHPTFADHLNNTGDKKSDAVPEKAIVPAPSMKKTSTFGDKNLDSKVITRPGTPMPKPDLPSTKPAAPPVGDTRRQSSTKPGSFYTEADAWEKAEMAKIKEKYEKLDTTILTWVNKKKIKAKRRLEKIEAELDKRRAKAMQSYREKVTRVDNIAGGAKAQAGDNRRNEELKVKEKANKMRVTGTLPRSCLCF